ncbi:MULTISPECIES: bifunctional 2-polyprenyl-6-hydroxyphenol methylase/3-demethylubiquinol 3-O-methyltransferase UbiG [Aphanizomenonaceae]|jgi:2-polyprenyl-3-methyl-5-hydroxy-6-metoxy-1,4-benzoquinol methylase|uniref:Methyltransferase domain-containing protein n=1 Tax=Dolichospermum heterosporum TAC447 TaxID=747523 RepID=A0ABY5LZJ8_9CYAN|nr:MULTISPECIES: methyltransferase domain-containing protein [Aphanizomenonaceae]MDK2408784.1 methyltransferase domain-containing protein [Aphanizomenon sp. 202]MDK2460220.1 methyltransferase domain-containing protein [Aphanizomenon sp. PH219]UUO16202.1 methyltransferase domain-containing protein [Dolichospermum heterosporum TAC447]
MSVSDVGNVENRAKQSLGASGDHIYQMVARIIAQRHSQGGVLVDVGCGQGKLYSLVNNGFNRYLGVDAVRYDDLPTQIEFIPFDLDIGKVPLPEQVADVVCAVEVIEHLENPRALMRELVRLTKPGGLVIVTTPNNLSLLSKLTLILKNQFNAFQEAPGLYPAHITALLEIDLIRIFTECGLTNINIDYSYCGRIPFTPWHWPKSLGFRGRAFSDNILCVGQKLK